VKKGSSVSEVVVGPENRTVVSSDNFLKVNLVGEYDNYNSMPTFEGMNLVTPRKVHHHIMMDTLTLIIDLQCSVI